MDDKILILEDSKRRISTFREKSFEANLPTRFFIEYVENAFDCIEKLSKGKYTYLFLDHDLGDREDVPEDDKNTGSEVVRWIEKNKPEIECIIIHSMNSVSALSMYYKLIENDYNTQIIKFDILINNMMNIR
jgi:hypothetical protein